MPGHHKRSGISNYNIHSIAYSWNWVLALGIVAQRSCPEEYIVLLQLIAALEEEKKRNWPFDLRRDIRFGR